MSVRRCNKATRAQCKTVQVNTADITDSIGALSDFDHGTRTETVAGVAQPSAVAYTQTVRLESARLKRSKATH